VRVEVNTTEGVVVAQESGAFALANRPTLAVIAALPAAPVAGAAPRFFAESGDAVTLRWGATDLDGYVDVELLSAPAASGGEWTALAPPLATRVPLAAGGFAWDVSAA
jgi:hypothetical protein